MRSWRGSKWLQERTPAAIEQFRKVVALDGKDAMSFNAIAYLLAESKQPDEAMKFAQKAKELAPDSAAVDDTLGMGLLPARRVPVGSGSPGSC